MLDLNRLEQVGVRLGFNVDDVLEYYVFRGTGEWLGQIAQFEKFGDISGDPVPPPPGAGKGARRLYRPFQTLPKMTRAQVDAAVAKRTSVFAPGSMMAGNGAPPTGWLAGKTMTLRYDDGPVMDYQFDDAETLRWRNPGGAWTTTRYQAWESAPGVILFGHLLDGAPNHDGHIVVADFDHGLVTCYNGYLNTPYFANEAGVKTLFGVVEMDGVSTPEFLRHNHTEEMLGQVMTWNYGPGLTSMHLYSTPHTVSWIIFTESGAGGLEWSGPGGFVKIRDGIYFIYWLEEACNGTLGAILVNLRTMRDVGADYHLRRGGPDPRPGRGALAPRRPLRRDQVLPAQDRRERGMTTDTVSSRRSFLKGGAMVAAPLAVAVPAAAMAEDARKARLARLEDEAAIRDLHQTWLRRINTGAHDDAAQLFADPRRAGIDQAVRGLAADHAGEPDAIKVAADGLSASGRFHFAVETETALAKDCTLAQMAHAQGGGLVRRTEARVLKADYVKVGAAWAIAKVELAAA